MKFFACIALLGAFGAASASFASDLEPLAWLLSPALNGAGNGLQQAAGNIEAAANNIGAGVHQVITGAGKVAANTAAGTGQTVEIAPGALVHTFHAIDHSPGVVGDIARTFGGGSQGSG